MQRTLALISGIVQGVNFRYFIYKKALELNIKGYVKNIENDRLEAVFEGPDLSVEQMIDFCKVGPPLSKVKSIIIKKQEFKNEFKDFKILK